MQLFLVLPWVLFLYKLSRIAGILFLALLFLINFVVTWYISWIHNFNISGIWSTPELGTDGNYQYDFYGAPWVRATPYLVGITFGLLYVNYKDAIVYEKKMKENPPS